MIKAVRVNSEIVSNKFEKLLLQSKELWDYATNSMSRKKKEGSLSRMKKEGSLFRKKKKGVGFADVYSSYSIPVHYNKY